jgi:Cysteine-rich CWC
MCLHETKYCPRCKQAFECKPGNIMQCQCYAIELTAEVKAYIEQRFNDCLCRNCLQLLQQDLSLFKEEYSPK